MATFIGGALPNYEPNWGARASRGYRAGTYRAYEPPSQYEYQRMLASLPADGLEAQFVPTPVPVPMEVESRSRRSMIFLLVSALALAVIVGMGLRRAKTVSRLEEVGEDEE